MLITRWQGFFKLFDSRFKAFQLLTSLKENAFLDVELLSADQVHSAERGLQDGLKGFLDVTLKELEIIR